MLCIFPKQIKQCLQQNNLLIIIICNHTRKVAGTKKLTVVVKLFQLSALPERFTGDRHFSTAIYFLLEQGNFSAFHKIKSDECWHFYAGQTLHVYVLHDDGKMEIIKIGNDIAKGELFQFVVPANCWFASRPAAESDFCFVGCTVAPGFDFADFEMAEEKRLTGIISTA